MQVYGLWMALSASFCVGCYCWLREEEYPWRRRLGQTAYVLLIYGIVTSYLSGISAAVAMVLLIILTMVVSDLLVKSNLISADTMNTLYGGCVTSISFDNQFPNIFGGNLLKWGQG